MVEKVLHASLTFLTTPDRLEKVSILAGRELRTYRWSLTILFTTRLPVLVLWNLTPAMTALLGVAEAEL